MRAVAAILAAVTLGGSFGQASATTVSLEADTMLVDISVEVMVSAQSVVAHFSTGADEPIVISLLPRGGGTYGIRTELPRKDFFVVFEAIGEPGHLSDPTTLSAMGAQLTFEGSPADPGEPEEPEPSESARWGWLAVALGAASLSALAFWVLGERDERREAGADEMGSAEDE